MPATTHAGVSCAAFLNFSHRRYNPLTGDWIIVSPNRISRPWSGHVEAPKPLGPDCKDKSNDAAPNPLSPGATRTSGIVTPLYTTTYMFPNDFPALNTEKCEAITCDDRAAREATRQDANELFAWAPAHGDCQVMCFHPESDKTLALMAHHEVVRVIQAWCELSANYRRSETAYRWLVIFENRGAAVGSSNMHPHCQVWACAFLPSLAERYDRNQWNYFERHKIPLLLDYAQQEEKTIGEANSRVVIHTDDWLVLVPWWACWPFETMVLPRKRHIRWLDELTEPERDSLAQVIQELLIRYDNLFRTDFPYTMGWYQAPLRSETHECTPTSNDYTDHQHWQLHATYLPPLLRSASVRKFMSGFELLAEAQRDLLPETAAEMLRKVTLPHYTRTDL